ncbi:MAG: formate/nitrite transporter family protein [Treponema sp.]|nr:formate/nitrite transporter family protein [Treponema sp.]MBQ1661802.1 formate/nitrite transporter family protein [Treponema sp.]MBQ2081311.1 formate/nitrite transporter family protein [Treponema sp.]MBR6297139.1 formate/nitrite transporter family protein [Treponema sp.]MEE3312532.1 formate/nitrite transporter family protein [Treponema sp.]
MNSPTEMARLYVDVGSQKAKLPVVKMFVLAIFAGMFIALGGFGSTVASFLVPVPALGRILGALIFPIGLMMVLVGGAELFTGNSLIIMPVLQKRVSVWRMLVNWIVVFLGNFVGGVLIAWLVTTSCTGGNSPIYGGALAQNLIDTATSKVNLSFVDAFVRGILCNFMVCMAVWVALAASDLGGKIAALYLPIVLFVLCGFEHCVANMYFIPAGLFTSMKSGLPVLGTEGLSWITFFTKNLLPVTLGNVVGGAVITGLGYWFVYLKGNAE